MGSHAQLNDSFQNGGVRKPCWFTSFKSERANITSLFQRRMPLLHSDFRRFLDALDDLNPAQIEDAQTKIRDLRRKTEAISEIEARTNQGHKCPFCGGERRQKWGRTRTKVQRYRCTDCQKTYSGRTGSASGRIHRPDLFMVVLRDMLDSSTPQSVRKLARQLGLNKYTVWRRRMLVILISGNSTSSASFSGIIEADETYLRESRKGSREWVRHFADPAEYPKPAASAMGGLHDAGVEDDARAVDVTAPHSHRHRPWRFSSLPAATEP